MFVGFAPVQKMRCNHGAQGGSKGGHARRLIQVGKMPKRTSCVNIFTTMREKKQPRGLEPAHTHRVDLFDPCSPPTSAPQGRPCFVPPTLRFLIMATVLDVVSRQQYMYARTSAIAVHRNMTVKSIVVYLHSHETRPLSLHNNSVHVFGNPNKTRLGRLA